MLKAFSFVSVVALASASYVGYANMQDKQQLTADLDQLSQVGNEQKSRIQSLNEEKKGLDTSLNETQKTLATIQQQLSETEDKLLQMTETRDQVQAALSADLLAESSARADLETQAAELERNIQSLRSEKNALLISLEQTQHNVSVQFETLTNTKDAVSQLSKKNRSLEAEKSALKLKLAEQTRTIGSLKEQEQNLIQDLEQAKQALDENSLEIQDQDLRIKSLEQKIEELQKQLSALNA